VPAADAVAGAEAAASCTGGAAAAGVGEDSVDESFATAEPKIADLIRPKMLIVSSC
jgi:hypothetical protein